MKNDYPKFEAILKEKQNGAQNYQQQLFHRQQTGEHTYEDHNTKGKVVWVSPEPTFTAKHEDLPINKLLENENEPMPTPTYHPSIFESPPSYDHESTPFSSGNSFGGPTLGYPGMDADLDTVLKASDKPEIVPTVPEYILKANENAKGQYPHTHGNGLRQHGHHR